MHVLFLCRISILNESMEKSFALSRLLQIASSASFGIQTSLINVKSCQTVTSACFIRAQHENNDALWPTWKKYNDYDDNNNGKRGESCSVTL